MDAGNGAELGIGWNGDGSMKGRQPPPGSEPAQKRMRRSMAEDHPYAYGFAGDQCDQTVVAEPAQPPVVDGFSSTGLPQAQSYGHMKTGPFNGWQAAQGIGRGAVNILHKTKLCTRYQAGSCSFDANCNFAHGLEELRKPPVPWEARAGGFGRGWPGPMQRPYKTKPCRFFLGGSCPYGDRCTFLHDGQGMAGQGNGGVTPQSLGSLGWKTRLCSRWERGEICGFGENCHFAHGPAELQSNGGETLQAWSGAVQPVEFNPMNEFSAAYRDATIPGIMPVSASYGSELLHQDSGWASTGVSLSTVGSIQNVNMYKETSAPGVVDDSSPNYGYKPIPNGWEKSGQAFEQKANSNHMYNRPAEQPDYTPYCQEQFQICDTMPFTVDNGHMPFTGDNGHHYLPDTTVGYEEAENLNNYAGGPGHGD